MKKKLLALLLSVAMLISLGGFSLFADSANSFPFGDVPASRWSNPYVVMLYENGIVNGVSENVFGPGNSITRAQFVKILGGIAGADTTLTTDSFDDVAKDSWYAPYVAWAVENGITNGVSATRFAPGGYITRQDMATMIYRYATEVLFPEDEGTGEPDDGTTDPSLPVQPITPIDPEEPGIGLPVEPKPPLVTMSALDSAQGLPQVNEPITFSDAELISDYAVDAVGSMQCSGIINGIANADGTYRFNPKGNATREQACKMLGELYLIITGGTLPDAVEPPPYSITYKLAGGVISGAPSTFKSDATTAIPNPVRGGYEFAGWTGIGLSKPTVNLVLYPGSAIDRTFVATWTPIEYGISYNLNGGTLKGAPTSYNIETPTFTIPQPYKSGYEFKGWVGTLAPSPNTALTVKKGTTGWLILEATWEKIDYQNRAFNYMRDWIDDNYNSGDGTVKAYVEGDTSGGQSMYLCAAYDRNSSENILQCEHIVDGLLFVTYLSTQPSGTPEYGCALYDAYTGELYFIMEGSVSGKLGSMTELGYYSMSGSLSADAELRELMIEYAYDTVCALKSFGNQIYIDIGIYGYDMTSFGI